MSWLIFLIALGLSSLFAGTEAGLISLNKIRLRHLARQRDPAAVRLEKLLNERNLLFLTVLVVTSLSNIVALVALGTWAVSTFGRAGYWYTLLIAYPLFLLVAEWLPKSIFRRIPYPALASIAMFLEVASATLRPFYFAGTWFFEKVLRLRKTPGVFFAREDLKYITNDVEGLGMLSSMERQMIQNVVDFRSIKVRDVMVPKDRVVCVRFDTSVEDVERLAQETGFDRLPVIDGSGRVLGLVNALDLSVDRRSGTTIELFLRKMLTVRESDSAPMVLHRLRAAPQGLASVVSVTGEHSGLVSVEDLLNPLVKVEPAPRAV